MFLIVHSDRNLKANNIIWSNKVRNITETIAKALKITIIQPTGSY